VFQRYRIVADDDVRLERTAAANKTVPDSKLMPLRSEAAQ
jgi:hypothetical protein